MKVIDVKLIMAVSLVLVALGIAQTAAATTGDGGTLARAYAAKKWYWTQGQAARRLKARFGSIRSASCIGFGWDWRFINGREYYRAFYCHGRLWNGAGYEVAMYPRGSRAFRVDDF